MKHLNVIYVSAGNNIHEYFKEKQDEFWRNVIFLKN